MSKSFKIYCRNTGEYMEVEGGETLAEVAARISSTLSFRPICAHVNNKTEDLGFPLFSPKQVELLDMSSPSGRRVYTRSLCMMLYKAVTMELPGIRIRMEHSVSHGHFCRLLDASGAVVNVKEDMVRRLLERMRNLSREDIPFRRREKLSADVSRVFARQGLDDKVRLMETTGDLYTTYYCLGDLADSYYGPLAPSTGHIGVFNLVAYGEGLLLLGPDPEQPDIAAVPVEQPKMLGAFREYLDFNRIIGVSDVGELNMAVKEKRTSQLINVAEALHNKRLAVISDHIAQCNSRGGARIVLIAGPSSSGKTTSTKRLAIQLMTNLIKPKMISLDDYFINREDTPLDEYGELDFESLYALDLERLNSDLRRLLAGERINLPTYSFELGRRIERERPLQLGPGEVLLIEGIHGLNPELTSTLSHDDVFKVYVSALTTLSIDDHNWISTTDTRLLRRIVRDHKYRHTSALESIRRWPSVRRGEERWIFPFQENADATFNSSLIFELGVMKSYVEPLLHDVPHNVEQYAEAYRLLKLLSYFRPIPDEQIPSTSLLREFLGGSSFHY